MWKTTQHLFKVDSRFRFGLIAMIICLAVILLAFVNPEDPRKWNAYERDLKPSLTHILGVSSMGQDIAWRLVDALKNSLLMALFAALISRIIALTVGLLAGYKGGALDRVLMSVNDTFIIIPLFPILILIASILKGAVTLPAMGLILGIFGWAWDARLFRSQILSLRERPFTYTARVSGMRDVKIIYREHLPFLVPLIMAATLNNIIWAIGMEVMLAILGLSSLNSATLGTMIYWAQNYQAIGLGMWNWILPPVIASVFIILGLYMFSVSIGQHLDPRTRISMLGAAKD